MLTKFVGLIVHRAGELANSKKVPTSEIKEANQSYCSSSRGGVLENLKSSGSKVQIICLASCFSFFAPVVSSSSPFLLCEILRPRCRTSSRSEYPRE